nr:succinyl-diaminopimelate desuccinylase [Boudabousia tangfeifanii]
MTTDNDLAKLAFDLVSIRSVSDEEAEITEFLEKYLADTNHLEMTKVGQVLVARTNLGREKRVVLAGHTDTVPISENTNNVPAQWRQIEGETHLWGRGSVDMKSGLATFAYLAKTLTEPKYDITYIFYDHEEVEAEKNGLGKLSQSRPELMAADFAILGEPTAGNLEGGCNGTLRVRLKVRGKAAHSARAWKGDNAIHKAARLINRIEQVDLPPVMVDGLEYRESLSVVWITGGIAKNSIPDECVVTVNYRFAPACDGQTALARLQDWLADFEYDLELEDLSEGARPGLDAPLAQEFVSEVEKAGGLVGPKYGWTDVSRFSQLGVPAVNFAPGDPMLCHTDEEACPVSQLEHCEAVLRNWLS